MTDGLYKFPRLYVTGDLSDDAYVALSEGQAHYLRNVLRRDNGDEIRLFNGRDGEWIGSLEAAGKTNSAVILQEQVRPQRARARRVHLLFTPIKKDRLDVLIEKAVELDATDLHPVLTERADVRDINEQRLQNLVIEAAEQCERLDIPVLHGLKNLDRKLAAWDGAPVFAGIERSDAPFLKDALVPDGDVAALVGPVGGWTDKERGFLAETKNVIPVSLGPNVLRCETAAASLLTRLAKP